jgi:hypothetical protein
MKNYTKYYALFFVWIALLAGCAEEKEMNYSVDPTLSPTTVTTGTVGDLTYSSAVVTASAASMNEGVVDRGIFIASDQNFTDGLGISATTVDSVTGNYTTTLSGLNELTQYYIKAYATSFAGGTSFGEVKNFTTLTAPNQWDDLVGTWTVTEDLYWGSWYNGEQYDIVISGVAGDKFKIKIDGFAPWQYAEGHTIYATIDNMKITLKSQELLPGWDEPDYKTWFAALGNGTFSNNIGRDFPETDIVTNDQGKLEITLLGGLNPYSYQIHDIIVADNSYGGYWCYVRNTKWVKK